VRPGRTRLGSTAKSACTRRMIALLVDGLRCGTHTGCVRAAASHSRHSAGIRVTVCRCGPGASRSARRGRGRSRGGSLFRGSGRTESTALRTKSR